MANAKAKEAAPDEEPVSLVDDSRVVLQNLGQKSIQGGASLAISEICCNAFRLLGTVVMARLLTPEHFGLVAMVTALTAFAEMFKDLGLGTATIQRKEITHQQVSTLFWLNAGAGVGIMMAMVLLSPLIAWFYADSRLLWVTIAISSTFFFGGLTVQHQALLRRAMLFSKLATIQVIATGVSMLIGIVLAWRGFEYWALVWKEIARAVIQVTATWLLYRWLPGWPVRGAGTRTMFQTGSHVTGFNILAFASRNLDQVLLGKVWGAGSVGLYKQAALILMIPSSLFSFPITYVMTPALSALQSYPDRYRAYYKKVLSFLSFGYMPLIAYLAVYADCMVAIILGEKWISATQVMQVLACGMLLEPMAGTCGIVMISSGKTREYLRVGIAQAIVLALAIFLGINWGVLGVALGVVGAALCSLPFIVRYSFLGTPITPRLFYEALREPMVASVFMSVILIVVRIYFPTASMLWEVGCSVILAPALYCIIWLVLPGGKQKLFENLSHIRLAINELLLRVRGASSLAAES